MTKRNIFLAVLAVLGIAGFIMYKILFPGMVTDKIPNPVSDKASLSKNLDEKSIPTNDKKNLYWGDLHVHTNFSFDAFIGGTRKSPSDAYRFAKGETIEIFGEDVKIVRPLDFAAVTDHAEFMGEMYSVQNLDAPGYYAFLARYFRLVVNDTIKQRELFNRALKRTGAQADRTHLDFFQGFETTKTAWQMTLEDAEKHYEPGKFTTFAAYEWTMGRNKAHLHRNIIFRDMKVPDYPMSALELNTPEQLWKWLGKIQEEGSTVMAIPHNTNLSKGWSFPDTMDNGQNLDANYIQSSNEFEPLVEVHQAKGNSEVNAQFWKNDEFADFENYAQSPSSENNFVRYALKKGLEHEEKSGKNPFKYGLIGSTDTHNALPGNTEENDAFIGNHTRLDLNAKNRAATSWILEPSKMTRNVVNPGGLVAVWAEANTRGYIYDALKRKETYATSGGRIQVRFFGGYDFEENYETYDELVTDGYEKGVPMGSDLGPVSGNRLSAEGSEQMPDGTWKLADAAPSFIIWAGKDPESANLDRVQVIKGWYKNGELQERIFNVALSDSRVVNEDGTVPDNDATVNMETGEWAKNKGAVELKTVWKDPEFDPVVRSFYYLRILELETPRWSLWDKIRAGVDFPKDTEMVVRERAWSSPIWYAPKVD